MRVHSAHDFISFVFSKLHLHLGIYLLGEALWPGPCIGKVLLEADAAAGGSMPAVTADPGVSLHGKVVK